MWRIFAVSIHANEGINEKVRRINTDEQDTTQRAMMVSWLGDQIKSGKSGQGSLYQYKRRRELEVDSPSE